MAAITFMKTPAESKLGEQFDALRALQPAMPSTARRAEAFERFTAKGLPHRRLAAWHYTDLRGLLRDAFAPAASPGAEQLSAASAYLQALPAPQGVRLVLVDGCFQPTMSSLDKLPAGVAVASLLDVLAEGSSFATELLAAENLGSGEAMLALNAAFMQGGVVLTLAEGVRVAEPIDLFSFATARSPVALTTRLLVAVGAGASVMINERHVSLGNLASQGNHALVFALDEGAAVDHVARLDGFPATALHVGTVLARLGAQTRFNSFTLMDTPGVTRRQSFLEFAGPHSNATFRGVTLLDAKSHGDTTLVVTHTAPHCESREYYKTILDGESTGVYQGKVVVAPGAQKTDGKMLSKAIFLADGASMYNKPELEIFADDVVCGHGATVGNLDEDQLFYLRARGIPLKEAQSLLLNAFAADAIEGVATDAIRDELTGSVEQWLRKRQS